MEQFIVICQQIIGGNGQPFTTVYGCDHERFDSREQAISHGFEVRGSDDFNIATVEGKRLTGFYWFDHDLSHDPDEMREVAKQLDLVVWKRSRATKGV